MVLLRCLVVFLFLLQACLAAESQLGEASRVVEKLNQTLVDVMKRASELGFQGRYRVLEPVIRETHDLSAIARYAVGRYWEQMSPQEQDRFVELFGKFSVATYVSRFNGYDGEEFRLLGEKSSPGIGVLVTSRLVLPDQEGREFEYILVLEDGQYRIINIMVDGVSDLALKRARYTSILKKKGVDALLEQLSRKITSMEGQLADGE